MKLSMAKHYSHIWRRAKWLEEDSVPTQLFAEWIFLDFALLLEDHSLHLSR